MGSGDFQRVYSPVTGLQLSVEGVERMLSKGRFQLIVGVCGIVAVGLGIWSSIVWWWWSGLPIALLGGVILLAAAVEQFGRGIPESILQHQL